MGIKSLIKIASSIVIFNLSTLFSFSQQKSDFGVFIDPRDGHKYKTVKIGQQVWLAENMAYLPSVSPSSVGSSKTAIYYVYGFNGTDVDAAKATSNYSTYGVLYNWPAALKACPSGWHLPSEQEWDALASSVGGKNIAGKILKSKSRWARNGNGIDEYGFMGLPGGRRVFNTVYAYLAEYASFWTSRETSDDNAIYKALSFSTNNLSFENYGKSNGFSVRYIKNTVDGTLNSTVENVSIESTSQRVELSDPIEVAKDVINKSYMFWNPLGYNVAVASYTIGKDVAMFGGGYLLMESPSIAKDMITGGFYKVGESITEDIVLNIVESSVKTPKKLCKSISRSEIDEGLKEYKIAYDIASKYIKSKTLTRDEAIKFLNNRWSLYKLGLARELYNNTNGSETTINESLAMTIIKDFNSRIDKKLQNQIDNTKSLNLTDFVFFINDLVKILQTKKTGLVQYQPYIDFNQKMTKLNNQIINEKQLWQNIENGDLSQLINYIGKYWFDVSKFENKTINRIKKMLGSEYEYFQMVNMTQTPILHKGSDGNNFIFVKGWYPHNTSRIGVILFDLTNNQIHIGINDDGERSFFHEGNPIIVNRSRLWKENLLL
jgi:uncharacterized protein (TIGR02145 family)